MNTHKTHLKKRNIEEIYDSEPKISGAEEISETTQGIPKADEYGFPMIRFSLYCTSYDGTRKDWREIIKILSSEFPNVTAIHTFSQGKMEEERKNAEESMLCSLAFMEFDDAKPGNS